MTENVCLEQYMYTVHLDVTINISGTYDIVWRVVRHERLPDGDDASGEVDEEVFGRRRLAHQLVPQLTLQATAQH